MRVPRVLAVVASVFLLVPAGTTFDVKVAVPVRVKVKPEPAKPAGSQVVAAQSGPSPGLNIKGTWQAPHWGELRFLQAPGDREVIGKGGGYDIDAVVEETRVILHFTSEGALQYSAELTPKGDGNILSGQYASGQMRANSKLKPIEMRRVLNVATDKSEPPPALNVDGAWYSPEWGKIQLTQAAGQREVIGKRGRHDIDGYVSGTRVVLHFTSAGNLAYSAELTAKGDGALAGRYSSGPMLGDSKTWAIEMTRQK
jgi:hypothetical protein